MSSDFYKKRQSRITVLFGVFIFFFLVVLYRAYDLQILGNSRLNSLAQKQYTSQLTLQPRRGTIYDRRGNILAIDIQVASIGLHPQQIIDREGVIKALSEHLGMNRVEIENLLNQDKKFIWAQRRVAHEKGEAIENLRLKGINIETEYRRFYPNGSLAGQLLGAVGYDAKALGGLELDYDEWLHSKSNRQSYLKDARGRVISDLFFTDSNHDLHLTIDSQLQSITEQALIENAEKHGVKSGFAIVTDVETGEILAMANYPSFDPNAYWKYPQEHWKNHAVIDTFEPGSTFKTILMASALNSGKVRPTDKFDTGGGVYQIGSHQIHDHSGYGVIDANKILQVSSNIGITKIAMKIGEKTFYETMKDMGFGKKSPLGFSGESPGILRNYKSWQDIEFSNISFGQGITVNGIQMSSAYTAIANGGKIMEPILVKSVTDAQGNDKVTHNPTVIKQAINPQASADLRTMLHLVTQTGGTAPTANVEKYLSGGKTGTAQKVNPQTRTYENGTYVSSFIGFAPLKNPKLAIYVVYDSPSRGGYYGGTVAGPVFQRIAKESLTALAIPPPENQEWTQLQKQKNDQKINSNAVVTSPESLLWRNKQLTEIENQISQDIVPDLRGLPLRRILQIASENGIGLTLEGNGIAVEQFPSPGSKLEKGQKWRVRFSRPS